MNRLRSEKLQRFLLSICLGLSLTAASSWGQLGGIDSEFAGAGARPLAMGGSFLALADDSTAAEFNPAGIRILRRPELAWQVTRTYDRRDEFLPISSTPPDGDPMAVFLDDENTWDTPSFISYVRPGQDFTWAISQLTTVDFVHHFTDPTPYLSFPTKQYLSPRTEATNNSFGLTFAKDLKPRLHVGVTFRMNRFDYSYFDNDGPATEFTSWAPNVNLGVLWRKSKDWSFGAVFKSSQKVEGESLGKKINATLPETWGAGVAYHPNDKLRILADIDYINWSEFDSIPTDGFVRDDVTRYHLGGEYMLSVNDDRAWFARAGYMLEESNALFYSGDIDLFQSGFPEEDALNHLSVGLGLAKEKYQLDLAVDHVLDGATTLILAMIHYF